MYSPKDNQSKRVRIIGHRGASGDAPENTIAAFDLAFDHGSDGIELDVRLTRDGIPIVMHDSTLLRTGGVSLKVSKCTMEEIRKVRLLNCHDPVHDGQTPPTLKEVLERYGTRGEIHIEIKCDGFRDMISLTQAVARLLREVCRELKLDPGQIWISSFHHVALMVMRCLARDHPRALIVTNRARNPFFRIPRFESLIAPTGVDAAWEAIVLPGAGEWMRKNLQIAGWPMDDTGMAGHSMFNRVDRIITNRPGLWSGRKKEFAFSGSI